MNKELEKKFERIWESAISEANRVKCEMHEYIDGVEYGICLLQECIDATEADLRKIHEEEAAWESAASGLEEDV